MKYEQDILRLLVEVGDRGLTLPCIVKHVYNANNSLFTPITESSVYQAVRSFVLKNTKSRFSLLLKDNDGRIKLNPLAPQYSQQLLQFGEEEPETTEKKEAEEPTLPFLFD